MSAKLNAAVESADSVFDLALPSDVERREIAEAIAGYEAANAPTDRHDIERMIGHLSVGFPNVRSSDAEAQARVALYADLLCDIPRDILAEAFRKVAQTSRFFPTVAEIREAAKHGLAIRSWKLMRLKTLALRYDRGAA